jgi:hypothetical protein
MVTIWIASSLFDVAAYSLALVLLTRLHLIARLVALEGGTLRVFLFSHQFLDDVLGIVDREAWNLS